jgi:hypothetical protein
MAPAPVAAEPRPNRDRWWRWVASVGLLGAAVASTIEAVVSGVALPRLIRLDTAIEVGIHQNDPQNMSATLWPSPAARVAASAGAAVVLLVAAILIFRPGFSRTAALIVPCAMVEAPLLVDFFVPIPPWSPEDSRLTVRLAADLGVDRYHDAAYLGYPHVADSLSGAMMAFITVGIIASFVRFIITERTKNVPRP